MLLLLALGWAAPEAKLAGPARVEVRGQILLDASGSKGDGEPEIELARGPVPVAVLPLYDRRGKALYALASPPASGTYLFIVITQGTPEGADGPIRAYAFHEVTVPDPTPDPTPIPPAPGPTPPGPSPPSPTPTVDLRAALTQVPADLRRQWAAPLAKHYRGMASLVGAYASVQTMEVANATALRGIAPQLKPFTDAVGALIVATGPRTTAELSTVYLKAAEALEAE